MVAQNAKIAQSGHIDWDRDSQASFVAAIANTIRLDVLYNKQNSISR